MRAMITASQLPYELDDAYRLDRMLGTGGMSAVYQATVDLAKFDFAMVVAFSEAARSGNLEQSKGRRMARYRLWQRKPNHELRSLCDKHGCPYPADRQAAVKVLHSHLAQRPSIRARFQSEWQALLSLASPHLVQVYGAGISKANGAHYYAMELIGDLLSLEEVAALPLPDRLRVIGQAAAGCAVLHKAGIVHRDLKPSNILVTRKDGGLLAKVTDLGIAKNLEADDDLTRTGAVFGTPSFMAPELAGEGVAVADLRSDIYSLGACLYQLLTGERPFMGMAERDIVSALCLAKQPKPLLEHDPSLPPKLVSLCDRMMAHDPAQRPASMREVVEAIEAEVGNQSATLSPPTVPPEEEPEAISTGGPDPSGWPTAPTAVAAAAVLLALLAVVLRGPLLVMAVVALAALIGSGLALLGEFVGRERVAGWLALPRWARDPAGILREHAWPALALLGGLGAVGARLAGAEPYVRWPIAGLTALLAFGPRLLQLLARPQAPHQPVLPSGARLVLMQGDEIYLEERAEIEESRDLIERAIAAEASDIHLEPRDGEYRVRFRVDGMLTEQPTLSNAQGQLLLNQLKVLAALDISERRMPQDGAFSGSLPNARYDFRASTIPQVGGEKLVVRVLDKTFKLMALEDLGLSPADRGRMQTLLRKPDGLIAVCGPSGGGKTTTLYSALQEIDASRLNVITIEDPVEYQLDDVCQIQVNPRAGLGFAGALRSSLRQDADVIMVGEVRDEETAATAFDAATTSHLVLTTLHAPDALTAVERLIDLGVGRGQASQGLTAVLAQRLVRRLCERCRKQEEADPELLAEFGLDPARHPTIWKPGECEYCNRSGYRGRVGIFELLVLDDSLREAIRNGASIRELRELAAAGDQGTLRSDGLEKARNGITALEEVLRVAG